LVEIDLGGGFGGGFPDVGLPAGFAAGGDGVHRVGGAHAMKAQRLNARHGQCLRVGVENDEAVFRFGGRRRGRGGVAFLVVLEAETQPLVSEKACEEVEIAGAVLRAHGALPQGLGDVEVEAHLRIVGQQFGDDGAGVQVLENIAVAAQAQRGESRLEAQAVAGHAAIGTQPGGAGVDAMPGTAGAVGMQQIERELFADETGQQQVTRLDRDVSKRLAVQCILACFQIKLSSGFR
jgi:hypothetical protein